MAAVSDKVLWVDLSNALMRAFSKLPEEKRTAKDLDYLVCAMLRKAIRRTGATRIGVAMDTVEHCWRYEYHPTYKEGRSVKDLSPKQLTMVIGPELRRRNIPLLYHKDQEADDLLATAAHAVKGECEVVVYSRDSDLYGLLDAPRTSLLWPEGKGEFSIIDKEDAEFQLGCPVSWLPMLRALTADRKDNLRGLIPDAPQRWPITRPRAILILEWYQGSMWDALESAVSGDGAAMRESEVECIREYHNHIVAIWQVARLQLDAPMRVDPRGCNLSEVNLETQ